MADIKKQTWLNASKQTCFIHFVVDDVYYSLYVMFDSWKNGFIGYVDGVYRGFTDIDLIGCFENLEEAKLDFEAQAIHFIECLETEIEY